MVWAQITSALADEQDRCLGKISPFPLIFNFCVLSSLSFLPQQQLPAPYCSYDYRDIYSKKFSQASLGDRDVSIRWMCLKHVCILMPFPKASSQRSIHFF